MLVAYPCHPYIHIYILLLLLLLYIYILYVVYSCLFHSLYSLYHWLSKPLFWPAHLIFSTSSTPRLSSHPHLPVSTSGLPLCRLQKTATSQPSTIHQPSTSHPSAIHQRRRGLSSEIFATANGFCQEGMTVLSAEAAVPFLGDLSRWGWDGGLRWRMMGFMAEPWENHRKTIGNLGKILCKWRFLAGKYHRTMACGQVDDQRVNCVIFRCFCFFVVSVLNNHKNFYVFVRLGFGWWILYLKWGYQLTMVLQLKWVARKVELVFIDSGYWHVFNVDTGQAVLQKWCMLFRRSHCPSHTPTRSINAPNAGRSCNCRLVHTQELKSIGSQWRGDKPTWRQHTTSYDMTSYSITISLNIV